MQLLAIIVGIFLVIKVFKPNASEFCTNIFTILIFGGILICVFYILMSFIQWVRY